MLHEVPAFLRPMTDEEVRAFKLITTKEIAEAIGKVDRALRQVPLATMRPSCPCPRRRVASRVPQPSEVLP